MGNFIEKIKNLLNKFENLCNEQFGFRNKLQKLMLQ